MDPEQTFLRVHARLSSMLAQLLSPRLRGLLEHLCLVVAILLLALLAVMHVNFVSQAGCAKELSRDKLADADLLQIKMVGHGLWSHKPVDDFTEDAENSEISASLQTPNELVLAGKAFLQWFGVNPWRSKGGKRHVMGNKENDIVNDNHNVASEESKLTTGEREATLPQIWDRWTLYGATWLAKVGDAARRFAKFWRDAGREFLFSNSKDGSHAFSQKATGDTSVSSYEKGSDVFEPVYLYSIERGYLLLPEDAKAQHNVRTANISISARNSCFGNRWQQLLINSLVGYDTILMNSLLDARGEGYLYNYQTKEFYDLNFPREARGTPSSFQGYVISKCGVLIMSLFVFFTTTMSVSFTLRETQARMLKFTVQLQYHARHRLPTFRLIFVHVIESLVFVPIMIGILFFLFEFYEDQLLAFMVLTLVWLCELFTMISVRTPVSMQYFPKYFFLYFMVFHIYFFSYEYGFSYLAFSTTAAFMQHLVLYFWNHFEVPALQRFLRVRMLLQQQHGVQITSSAIITSMLQVTSLTPSGASPATGFDNRALSPRQHARPIGGEQNGAGSLSQVFPGGVFDRMYVENLNGVNRNTPRPYNSLSDANAPVIRNPTSGNNTVSTSERETGGVNAGLQQGFSTAAANNALGQPNPMSSFGSILLWILGGPSENLSAFFPLLRDSNGENVSSSFNENTTARRPSPQEEGIQNLRHEEGIQNLRWRGRTTETQ